MIHDQSKLQSPEVEIFTEYTPKLKTSTYGSPEYKGFLEGMNVALSHHYENNSHHPEHYADGIKGMNLFDIVEMLCDWLAATQRHDNGNIVKSIAINKKRFGYSHDLWRIFENTIQQMFKYTVFYGCVDGRQGGAYGNTVEEFQKKIDLDIDLNDEEKNILKYGYFKQFEDGIIDTCNMNIDNGFDVYWFNNSK